MQEAPLSDSPSKKDGAAEAAAASPDGVKVPSNGQSNGEQKTEDDKVGEREKGLDGPNH